MSKQSQMWVDLGTGRQPESSLEQKRSIQQVPKRKSYHAE
jgi:hypothetical protein